MYDMIVIGAGTAGLSAAIYGLRAGRSVLILEEKSYGGQIVNAAVVENYPGIQQISGFAFATNLYQQAVGLGAEVKYERVEQIRTGENHKIVSTGKQEYEGKSVVIATGVRKRALGLEREEELVGSGVSYCATCDGAFFRGKDVAIVGGGNTALEDALFLSEYCRKVFVIHRRKEFRGEEKLVAKLKEKDTVEFILESRVTKLNGSKSLESIEVQQKETGACREVKVDGLFIAVGQIPDNTAFQGLIPLDEQGYIQASENCRTGTDGIFAAGDCRTKQVRQLTTAAADGTVAALAACEYLAAL